MRLIYSVISKKGKRAKNEDSVYPAGNNIVESSGLFIVCDGVGGAENGEIASKIASNAIKNFLTKKLQYAAVGENEVQAGIAEAEADLRRFVKSNPESRGLSTTLALLYIQGSKALTAHIGDSRVYHIRNGEILFKTSDHSFVNDLIATGFITAAEAVKHPKKNVINRALSGDKSAVAAEFNLIPDIQTGDYFLLCSDGLLEGIDEEFIKTNFISNKTAGELLPERIMTKIDALCSEKSADNYTGISIQIAK
jgi:PPM family protein phosphatase